MIKYSQLYFHRSSHSQFTPHSCTFTDLQAHNSYLTAVLSQIFTLTIHTSQLYFHRSSHSQFTPHSCTFTDLHTHNSHHTAVLSQIFTLTIHTTQLYFHRSSGSQFLPHTSQLTIKWLPCNKKWKIMKLGKQNFCA